jgi:hypothetical protein
MEPVMTEAKGRPLAADVTHRYVWYDIANDIYYHEVSAAEVDLVQAARRACGRKPLVFLSLLIDEHVALIQATDALRDVLQMPHGSYLLETVLEAAVRRLRTNGARDA